MEKIESRLEENVKSIKRKTLGFFGKFAFKSREELARVFRDVGVTVSLEEAKEVVDQLPNNYRLNLPSRLFDLSPGYLNFTRLQNPVIPSDSTYKIEKFSAVQY